MKKEINEKNETKNNGNQENGGVESYDANRIGK